MKLKHEVLGSGLSGGLMILGEAPGEQELKQKRPFVGPAGQILRRKLREVGLDPLKVRLENVIERKLEGNNEQVLYHDSRKQKPKEELLHWHDDVKRRIKEVKPKLVIAAGDTAMRAVTFEQSISKSHCYVIKDNKLSDIPVIPMYHPMFIGRQPEFGIWMNVALQKGVQLMNGLEAPERTYILEPNLDQVLNFLKRCEAAQEICVDIEKNRRAPHEMTCIGIALSPYCAISIPFASSQGKSYWPKDSEKQIWKALASVLANPKVAKIFQNFIFDCMVLSKYGLEVSGPITDTLVLANLLTTELKKSLADLGRLYLFTEPWKGTQDWNLKGSTYKDLWLYNAKDCVYTYEICLAQREGLALENLESYYRTYIEPLYPRVYEICARGWNINEPAREELKHELDNRLAPLLESLVSTAAPHLGPARKKKRLRDKEKDEKNEDGTIKTKAYKEIYEESSRSFNPSSPLQVKEVLSSMGVRLPTREGKQTTDERALLKINRKYGLKFIPQLLEYRELQKLKTTYCEIKKDPDGRVRFSVNLAGTKSGRLSSQQTPWDTGCNSQNIPKSFRQVIIPDNPSKQKLLQVDLSQAELRVVAWLSGEEKLIQMLDAGQDIHQFAADKITEISGFKASRQLGKQANHAGNYSIGPNKFADLCLMKCNIAITHEQAKKILDARMELFPKIKRWQEIIADEVETTRELKTPLGRLRTFYGRFDDDLIREALSFVPQSVVVDVLNRAWSTLSEDQIFQFGRAQFLQQGHDSLLCQVYDWAQKDLISLIDRTFKALTFKIHDKPCLIPHDITIGPNWRDLKDVK